MQLAGRHESAGDSYRYGFQNQEVDPEVKGEGNSVNYKYRMHDPRLGRFFAVDPLADKYPHNSPYAFSENVVINSIELEGLEQFAVIVVTSSVDPALKIIHIRKTSETTTNDKPLEVAYTYKDASGNIINALTLDCFVEGSSEEHFMNKEYVFNGQSTGMNRIQAMNVTELTEGQNGTVSEVRKNDKGEQIRVEIPGVGKSTLVGQICFQYDLKILFNPNKAEISAQELQSGTYNKAIVDISELKKTIQTPIPVSFYQGNGNVNKDLSSMNMLVNGETDSQISNPPFPSVNGLPEGNESLGQKRADNLLLLLLDAHPTNNSTNVINHTGKVKSEDRNSSIFFGN